MNIAEVFKAQGNDALQSQKFAEAVSFYTKAINVDGSNAVYYSNRSAAYLSMGDAENALSDANVCIGLDPNFAKGYSRKGAALYALKRFNDSVAAYASGLAKFPEDKGLVSGFEAAMKAKDGPGAPSPKTKSTKLFGPEMMEKIGLKQKEKSSFRADATRPINFDTASKIEGLESQIVTITIEPGQVLRAESGAMIYMTEGVEMNTTTGGGLSAGVERILTSRDVFIRDYTYDGVPGTKGLVALGTDFPSKIIRLNIQEYGGKIICQKGTLLCASHTIEVQNFQRGLHSLTGEGDVFVKAGGTLIKRVLKPGEVLRVSLGCLIGFSYGIDYNVQKVKGINNILFSSEDSFIKLIGGTSVYNTVWLQGMPPKRMIGEIARKMEGVKKNEKGSLFSEIVKAIGKEDKESSK